jgi:hypothetical protein
LNSLLTFKGNKVLAENKSKKSLESGQGTGVNKIYDGNGTV